VDIQKLKINPPMKKLFVIPFAVLVGLLFFQGKSTLETSSVAPAADLPADVKAVVDKKCYGCHNANSKNEKGKAKLDWDALAKQKKSKRVGTMGKISDVLEKGEMPPKKFLENKPEAALSEAELATLVAWSAGKKKSK
jgi:mono/diheme cytochrome c family protein